MKITFEVLRADIAKSEAIHEIDIADDDDGMEDQVLIGLCIELHGKNYEVINQIVDVTENRNIIYYVQAATKNTA